MKIYSALKNEKDYHIIDDFFSCKLIEIDEEAVENVLGQCV